MSFRLRIRAASRRANGLTALGVLCAAATLAGCGSSSPGTTSSTAKPGSHLAASHSEAVSAAAAAVNQVTGTVASYPAVPRLNGTAKLKGKTVWFVPLGEAIPNIAAEGEALGTALGHLGIHMHVCDGQLLPTTVASCINQAVQQGASGVVTAYIDYKAVPAAINNAISHQIPVLVGGESNDAGSGASKLLGFWDDTPLVIQLAKLAADAAIADSDGKGDILYLGSADSPGVIKVNTTAADQITSACPKCSFHGLTYLSADSAKVPSEISAALIRYPQTNYIVVGDDPVLSEVSQGVDSAGFGTKLKIITLGGSLSALQTIKSGDLVTGDGGFSNAYIGWDFADQIARLMLGEQSISYIGGIRFFNKQNLSGLSLTPAAYASGAWYGTDQYESLFLNAWAGK